MLIPMHTAQGLVLVDNAPVDIQQKMQYGCSCCGWEGDRSLALRQLPVKKGPDLWGVFQVLPGQKPVMFITADFCDHRLITALHESKKQAQVTDAVLKEAVAAEARHEAEVDAEDNAMQAELVHRLAHALSKDDQL